MNNIPRVLVMSITAGDESFSADRVSVKMRSTFQLIHPRHKEMQNFTNQTSILAYSHTMTIHSALIAITCTTYTRSLREPQQVMLCQSAADLSVHSASHPSTFRFNRGNRLLVSQSLYMHGNLWPAQTWSSPKVNHQEPLSLQFVCNLSCTYLMPKQTPQPL